MAQPPDLISAIATLYLVGRTSLLTFLAGTADNKATRHSPMAALELKDITNLPSSLPISQIPQTQADNRLCHSQQPMPNFQHRLQPHPAFQKDMKHLSLQQRVAAFAGNDSGYDLMDDSLTDMRWLQRMDAGMSCLICHAYC